METNSGLSKFYALERSQVEFLYDSFSSFVFHWISSGLFFSVNWIKYSRRSFKPDIFTTYWKGTQSTDSHPLEFSPRRTTPKINEYQRDPFVTSSLSRRVDRRRSLPRNFSFPSRGIESIFPLISDKATAERPSRFSGFGGISSVQLTVSSFSQALYEGRDTRRVIQSRMEDHMGNVPLFFVSFSTALRGSRREIRD